jgi:hypothetical protein
LRHELRGTNFLPASLDFSVGYLGLWAYILQPLNLLLIYLVAEGAVRLMAAVTTNEVIPSLPLAVLSWGQSFLSEAHSEWSMGERVPDSVELDPADSVLRIESCRPKQWNDLTTIRYRDQLFELATHTRGEPPRPYVYLLRLAPEHKVVRGMDDYDPEQVLKQT